MNIYGNKWWTTKSEDALEALGRVQIKTNVTKSQLTSQQVFIMPAVTSDSTNALAQGKLVCTFLIPSA